MKVLLTGATVYNGYSLEKLDIAIADGVISELSTRIDPADFDQVFPFEKEVIVPGFVDVHTHLREPGFFYKETIASGTKAAVHGGYTTVFSMPNLNPVPDTLPHLQAQLDIIEKSAVCKVVPFGAITSGQKGAGELADMAAMAPFVAGFSDDGVGVQDEELMRRAMVQAHSLNKIISAHCEDNAHRNPKASIHDGAYAKTHKLPGISSESEYLQVQRDLKLAEETDCDYHVCHVSTKESVAAIRDAKARGVHVTCETAPHYLLLCDEDLQDDGRFKMNPPLRGEDDQHALIEGLLDGTIDMIATDHAPHSKEEKGKGLSGSMMGIVGLETAFPLLYTYLVKDEKITLEKLIELMSIAPRRRFGLPDSMRTGAPADLTVLDLDTVYAVNPRGFYSKGRATPFMNWPVQGRVVMTFVDGKAVYTLPQEVAKA